MKLDVTLLSASILALVCVAVARPAAAEIPGIYCELDQTSHQRFNRCIAADVNQAASAGVANLASWRSGFVNNPVWSPGEAEFRVELAFKDAPQGPARILATSNWVSELAPGEIVRTPYFAYWYAGYFCNRMYSRVFNDWHDWGCIYAYRGGWRPAPEANSRD